MISADPLARPWQSLTSLNLYRMGLAALFSIFALFGHGPSFLGIYAPRLFAGISLAYLLFSLANALVIHLRRPPFEHQVVLHILGDYLAIILLMHASGGIGSGLGLLLLVPVAAGGLLLAGRLSLFFASLAALGVLGEQVYAQWQGSFATTYYAQAGMLGAAYFATAILAHGLGVRARQSEALASQREADLAHMTELARYIVEKMQTGVLVVDAKGWVRLMNQAAREMLGRGNGPMPLEGLSLPLAEGLERWRKGQEVEAFQAKAGGQRLMPRLASLGEDVLIFLEDTAALSQRAQQLKLASLGRLTASIAHEVRNPLAAISHAAQLLGEAPLPPRERRLSHIIEGQCKRVNEIVENVLQLSRRKPARPKRLHLVSWLERFVEEFKDGHPEADIRLEVQPETTEVNIDPTHLKQILYNLCENSLRYSPGKPLRLLGGLEKTIPFLEVWDEGPGIPKGAEEAIFEPFYTTEPKGSGLGLYIARELCECNRARLNAIPQEKGACLRIDFVDIRRIHD